MLTLTHSPFLKALGWSLLNSLWQFGVLWLVFVLVTNAGKRWSPALKHGLALALISGGFLWFAIELSVQYLDYSDTSTFVAEHSSYTVYPIIYRSAKLFLENNLSWFSMVYLLVVAGFFIRFTRFFFHSHTIQTRGLSKLKPELRLYIQKLLQQLDITRQVSVWISDHVDTPMIMGFIKPVVLIPIASVNQLSIKQLEAILLHELAHIKRNDYLVNLYTATIEILFFFNPFARLLVKAVQHEREKSCDDWVLQFRFDPHQYASALLSLEQSRASTYSLAIAASGKNKNLLLQRVQRIMGVKTADTESGFRMIGYLLSIGLLSFIAFVNPGNLVVENFEKKQVQTSNQSYTVKTTLERMPGNTMVSPVRLKQSSDEVRKPRPAAPETKAEAIENENSIALTPVSLKLDESDDLMITGTPALLHSAINENLDFSIKEKQPAVPEPTAEVEFPYVPNSSYSYYVTEDSNMIRLKVEKEKQLVALQSLAQAQKAISSLDWQKIAKSQNLSKAAIAKLQNEINKSFKTLNWSQIYKESVDSLDKVNIQGMRTSLIKEYEKMNSYKTVQKQYESIKNELQLQQERYKSGAETELEEINKQVKKRKVTVYL